jgi:AcrR family transcriptional regulator
VTPRPYNLGKRLEQIDHGRRQILDAARALLADAAGYTAFTVDAVAKRADVARGTVYYQFGSKSGLLEALCDDLAETGGLADLPQAFGEADARDALAAFIVCFGRFWQADRTVMRRLRALAALDPEVHAVVTARDQRRSDGLEVVVSRLVDHPRPPSGLDRERAVRTLLALTSFETFDVLAANDQDVTDVVPQIVGLAQSAMDQAVPPRRRR